MTDFVPFNNVYEVIFEYSFDVINPKKVTFLGQKNKHRTCIFCRKSEPLIKFKNKAHVIPAAFGNRTLFSYQECDGCNLKASSIENDISNYLTLTRSMARKRSRKGTVKYKPKGLESYICSGINNPDQVNIKLIAGENGVLFEKDENKKEIKVTIQRPPFNPTKVCKALAKMAFFVLDPNMQRVYDWIRKWLRSELYFLPSLYRGFIPGTGLIKTSLRVSKNKLLPSHLLVQFEFSTAVLFMYLPEKYLDLSFVHPQPSAPFPIRVFNLCKDEIVSGGLESYNISYAINSDEIKKEIGLLANSYFEKRNYQHGQDLNDWLKAEREVKNKYGIN